MKAVFLTIKKAPISWDSFVSVEGSLRGFPSQCRYFNSTTNYEFVKLQELPRRAAGETCTRTSALTNAEFLCMNFGGKRPPGQYYVKQLSSMNQYLYTLYEENFGGQKMKKSPAKTNFTGALFVVINFIIKHRTFFVNEFKLLY